MPLYYCAMIGQNNMPRKASKKKYREILSTSYSLAKANFKVRNEGSYLGILWYLLNPLSYFVIILYLRGVLFSVATVSYYPIYLLMGLTMLNFFNQSIGASIDLIRNNAGFIKSMKIPYEIFVVSILFQAIFSHIFELLIVAILFIYFHVSLIGIIWYIVTFIFFAAFTLGLCFLFSTIGLYFSDFRNIWSIFSQLLLFVTPIFYVVNPGNYIYLSNLLNPLFYFMTTARDVSIYAILPPFWIFFGVAGLACASLIIGFAFFHRFKDRFAEFV